MDYNDAFDHSPSDRDIDLELRRHGHADRTEFLAYCLEFDLKISAPGVLLGFLGY